MRFVSHRTLPASQPRSIGARQAQRGAVTLVAMAMVLVLATVGLLTVGDLMDAVEKRRARAASIAAARTVAQRLFSADAPSGQALDIERIKAEGIAIARANSGAPQRGMRVEPESVEIGPDYVEVRVRSLRRPGRLFVGRVRLAPAGALSPKKLFPAGVELSRIPEPALQGDGGFDLSWQAGGGLVPLRMDTSAKTLKAGDAVAPRHRGAWDELAQRTGQAVEVPLLDRGNVSGFGLFRVESVDQGKRSLRLSLAPSALAASARLGDAAFRRRAAAVGDISLGLLLAQDIDFSTKGT